MMLDTCLFSGSEGVQLTGLVLEGFLQLVHGFPHTLDVIINLISVQSHKRALKPFLIFDVKIISGRPQFEVWIN